MSPAERRRGLDLLHENIESVGTVFETIVQGTELSDTVERGV